MCFKKNTVETILLLQEEAFGNEVLGVLTIKRWHKMFRRVQTHGRKPKTYSHCNKYQCHCDHHQRGPSTVSTSLYYRIENQSEIHICQILTDEVKGSKCAQHGYCTSYEQVKSTHFHAWLCDKHRQAKISDTSHYSPWVVDPSLWSPSEKQIICLVASRRVMTEKSTTAKTCW